MFITGFAAVALSAGQRAPEGSKVLSKPVHLRELVAEVHAGGSDYRHATILEVQRSRPVIDFAGRHVVADHLDLGKWRIPKGYNVLVSIALLHDDSSEFARPDVFDPTRFLGTKPPSAWLPFGGGTRRCIGAAFATMEMDVTLRTLLADFELMPTSARSERWFSRGGVCPVPRWSYRCRSALTPARRPGADVTGPTFML